MMISSVYVIVSQGCRSGGDSFASLQESLMSYSNMLEKNSMTPSTSSARTNKRRYW